MSVICIQLQCYPPIQQLHFYFRDFSNIVHLVMKITTAKRNPDMDLLTQQTVCFSPNFWLEPVMRWCDVMADSLQTRILWKVDGQFLHAHWWLQSLILDAQTL